MTDEVKVSVVFWGNHQVRFLELDGGAYVPVTDIAKATGVRKRSLLKIMDRSVDIFAPHERDAPASSQGGTQRTRCIDSDGAHLLLAQINNHHIKNQDTRAKLLEFNDMIRDRAAGKIVSVPALPAPAPKPKPDFDHIWAELQFIKRLAKETGWDLNELRIAALRDHNLYGLAMVGEKSKPAEPPLALPAPAPKPKVKDYMTATDIGELCGMSAQQINKFLYNNHYIIKDDAYDWRMTELGREYGEERVLEPSTGILVITCFWKKEILEKMNINSQRLPA